MIDLGLVRPRLPRIARNLAPALLLILLSRGSRAATAQTAAPQLPPAPRTTSPAPQQPSSSGTPSNATAPQAIPVQPAPSGQTAPPQGSAPAPGANETPASDEPITTIKVQANEVNLIFTVTDRHGRFITGLKRENFGLLDDGHPPEAVIGFRQQTDLPLRVGVMIDTSSSIRSRFQFEQEAAVEFFLQILHRNDRAFVMGFDVQNDLEQDYTASVDKLNTGVHKLRPGGGTALYDALYKTCKDQMLTLRPDEAIRKAIVLVSDGDDNYSRAELSDAIKMCQRAETIIYTISTNVSPSRDKGDDILQKISDETGGHAFFPTKIEDVATGFHNVEQELRSQYSLQYRPAYFRADGAFRTIYLQTLDTRYKVNTRKGYFAPRPPQPGE